MSAFRFFLIVAVLGAFPVSGRAAELVTRYVARLGLDDHFNSSGERLTSAAAIIRQDRANLYVYKAGDREDQTDEFFDSKSNRALLESLLNAGGTRQSVTRAIVNGNPLVEVSVYPRRVVVRLLD